VTKSDKKSKQKRVVPKNELLVLINGALIMIVELVAARIITPYVGSSSFVWTAIIGVMLGALAAGYAWGGRLADNAKATVGLAKILFFASLCVLFAVGTYAVVLDALAKGLGDVRAVSVLGSFVLFAPSAFFMGSVSPYIATRSTLHAKRTETGQKIGSIYAYGTAGSILGTFLCGFWLTSYFTNASILVGVATTLLVLSLVENTTTRSVLKNMGIFVVTLMTVAQGGGSFIESALYKKDTAYSSYAVFDARLTNGPVRVLATDRFAWQTGVSLSEPQKPAFDYIRAFEDVIASKKEVRSVLLLGGGAFSFTTVAAPKYPAVQFDVVEIDPALTKISAVFFGRVDMPNVRIHNKDARVFTKEAQALYDIILVDVFSSLRPPFHLTTSEFVELAKSKLATNGIVAANIIGSFDGQYASFPASQAATYAKHFSNVSAYPVTAASSAPRENILLIASDGRDNNLYSKYPEKHIQGKKHVFTDEYAPVDRFIGHAAF
jgi:hypothetical protein